LQRRPAEVSETESAFSVKSSEGLRPLARAKVAPHTVSCRAAIVCFACNSAAKSAPKTVCGEHTVSAAHILLLTVSTAHTLRQKQSTQSAPQTSGRLLVSSGRESRLDGRAQSIARCSKAEHLSLFLSFFHNSVLFR